MTIPAAVGVVVDRVAAVDGVVAVALGGSRATGTAIEGSDTDLGVYYDGGRLDLEALQAVAGEFDGAVAGPGGWGPWVDGGAWLRVDGEPVDIILRDVRRVEAQCLRARAGQYAFHPQPGHPLGFLDVAYAGEVAVGVPLVDRHGVLARLKELMTPYPPALRDAMITGLWEADFLLDAAGKGARRGDTVYVALCLSTAAMLVAHAWHAAAGVWVLNEKDLVPGVARLTLETGGFAETALDVCAAPGSSTDRLLASIGKMRTAPRPSAD